MSKQDIIKLEAVGEFPFTFFIEKAVASEETTEKGSDMILEGIASTTNIDHDKERMSKDALLLMEAAINKDGVPLRVEHNKEGDAIIGKVFKAWVDDRNQLHVRARLDKSHPVSPVLHHAMKNGVKMGLSVGGLVKRAVKEFAESVGGMVKTFYDVALQEVSVTPRPANYDSWLVAKSIAKDVREAELYSENEGMRREFLFENGQLDYLQAFAKSVPDKAWRKVESPLLNKENQKTMSNEDVKKESSSSTDEATKAVSREEFNGLQKAFKDLSGLVSKGFENMGHIMSKALNIEAADQANPKKEKPKFDQPTAKALEVEAHDQNEPDKDKPKFDQPTAKADSSTDETTKAGSSETDETTKAGSETDETTKAGSSTGTYDLETVTRSIETLSKLTKKIKKAESSSSTDEATKASTTDEDGESGSNYGKVGSETDTDTTKAADQTSEDAEMTTKYHPLDVFVATVTKAMEAVVERLEKKGQRVLGFEKEFIEKSIKGNPEMQAEIIKLLNIPGFKKSVSMGVPYMVMKDGRRMPLINAPESVEKSEDMNGKSFKDVYKTKYSSVQESTNE